MFHKYMDCDYPISQVLCCVLQGAPLPPHNNSGSCQNFHNAQA